MNVIRVVRDPFRPGDHEVVELPDGITAADALAAVRDRFSTTSGLAVSVAGRRVADDELAAEPLNGADVVVGPVPSYDAIIAIAAIIAAILVRIGLSYLYGLLVGKPKVKPQDRGDLTSATYAWDQIHTDYRPGMPIPLVFGEHDVGGQVIYTALTATHASAIVALSEGRIDSIGGIKGTNGHATGVIPADLKINGNAVASETTEVVCDLRMGTIDQTPMPRFPGAATTIIVSRALDDAGDSGIGTIADVKPISKIDVVLFFPIGLYEQGNPPRPWPIVFRLYIKKPSETQWRDYGDFTVGNTPEGTTKPFLHVHEFTLPATETGPLEVQILRQTVASPAASQCIYSQLVYHLPGEFGYPGVALVGVRAELASEVAGNGRLQYTVRMRGIRVRVWDATHGLSAGRYWDLPENGDQYYGIWTYPPGRNPAWVLAEFLTHRAGVAEFSAITDIDWPAFRNWADFCDRDAFVGATAEAAFCCDLVLDKDEPAWDQVLRICQTGRATPVIRGSQISVVYQYYGAHGRGTNAVAAKSATQLITSSNVRDFVVSYMNTRDRPGVITLQFLDQNLGYVQDAVNVEDPTAGYNDPTALNPLPFTNRTEQLYGVTRRSQVIREGLFMHDVAGKIRSQIQFDIGPEALAAEVGDVISVQHDVFRPFQAEAFAYRTTAATNTSSVILDRPVTIAPATTYGLVIKDTNGDLRTRTVTMSAGTHAAGTPITFSGGTVDVDGGAQVAFGLSTKVVKDYQIVHVALAEDLQRKVIAVEWVPSIHTLPNLSTVAATFNYSAVFDVRQSPNSLVNDNSDTPAGNIRLTALGSGQYRLSWTQPDTYSASRAKVYVRQAEGYPWQVMGEVRSNQFDLTSYPGESFQVAVGLQNLSGAFQTPEVAGITSVTADEFPFLPVAPVRGLTSSVTDASLRLAWADQEPLDFDYFEVRRGPEWIGAEVVAQTRDHTVNLPLPPYYDGTVGLGTYMVRARATTGLYSTEVTTISPTENVYSGRSVLLDQEPNMAAVGTLTNTQVNSGVLSLTADAVNGTWVSPEYALGYDARVGIVAYFEGWGLDTALTVDEAAFAVDSGEALWQFVDGREASLANPGIYATELVDDVAVAIDDLPANRRVGAHFGEPGINHAICVEVRHCLTAESISSAAWGSYQSTWRELGRIQIRVSLAREDLDRDVYLQRLRVRLIA